MVAEYDAATKGRTLPKTAELHESFLETFQEDIHAGFLKRAGLGKLRLPQPPAVPRVAQVGATPGLHQMGNLGNKVRELGKTQAFNAGEKAINKGRTMPVGG